jgi:hypothetical protein
MVSLYQALDHIRKRFGPKAVRKAIAMFPRDPEISGEQSETKNPRKLIYRELTDADEL